MIEGFWLIFVGFAAGLLGSMIGLGGGIITVPVLTFLGFPPTVAASNSLFVTLSNSIASIFSYTRQKKIHYSLGLKLGLLAVPGTILGAAISTDESPDHFKILFGLVLVASVVYFLLKRNLQSKEKNTSIQMTIFVICASFFAGIISSFFGIGGGAVFVPLMIIGMGLSMRHAASTSQLILFFTSLSGIISHSFFGHSDFSQVIFLVIGGFVGGLAGARLSIDVTQRHLQILISLVLLATAAKLFLDSIVW